MIEERDSETALVVLEGTKFRQRDGFHAEQPMEIIVATYTACASKAVRMEATTSAFTS